MSRLIKSALDCIALVIALAPCVVGGLIVGQLILGAWWLIKRIAADPPLELVLMLVALVLGAIGYGIYLVVAWAFRRLS